MPVLISLLLAAVSNSKVSELGSMENGNGYESSLELMLLNFGGNVNDVTYGVAGAGADPNQYSITADERDENQANALPLPHLFRCQRIPLNYYEFLTKNSPLHEITPTDMLDSMTEFQTELTYSNPGIAGSFKPVDSSPDMEAWKLNPYLYMFNTNNHEALRNQVRCSKRYHEEGPLNKLESSQDQSQTQNHMSWIQAQSEATGNVSQSHPRTKVAASVVLSNPCYNVSRERAASSDRKRRQRIAERLEALQELLPHSVEGSQTAVVDEIIRYVKDLQLQMMELTQSKLGGDFCSCPSTSHEGYHHHTIHEQTMNEPLEETMANLLKVNSYVATKYLESKGLLVMPMALADRLQQTL